MASVPAWSAPRDRDPAAASGSTERTKDRLRAAPAAPSAPSAPPSTETSKPSDGSGTSKTVSTSPSTPKPKPKPGTSPIITVTKKVDLQFGRMVMIGQGGSVRIPADGLMIYDGLVPAGGNPGPARFLIRGPANRMVYLQLTFPLTGDYGAGGTARLDTLAVSADYPRAFKQDGSLVSVQLDSSGNNAITVGGTLTLSSPTPGRTSIFIPISAELVSQ